MNVMYRLTIAWDSRRSKSQYYPSLTRDYEGVENSVNNVLHHVLCAWCMVNFSISSIITDYITLHSDANFQSERQNKQQKRAVYVRKLYLVVQISSDRLRRGYYGKIYACVNTAKFRSHLMCK